MTILGIQECRVSCIIGCTPSERDITQELSFDIEYSLMESVTSDELSNSLDYVQVVTFIKNTLQKGQYLLIEFAAKEIVEELLRSFSKIEKITFILYKPHPIAGVYRSYAKVIQQR